jgi:hypothetical protein
MLLTMIVMLIKAIKEEFNVMQKRVVDKVY